MNRDEFYEALERNRSLIQHSSSDSSDIFFSRETMDVDDYYTALQANQQALQHHGIKGQKWGLRRYQNPDGTLTEEGKKHYGRYTERTKDTQYHTLANQTISQQASMGNAYRSKGKEAKAREWMSAALANAESLKLGNEDQMAKEASVSKKAGIAVGLVSGIGGAATGFGGLALSAANLPLGIVTMLGGYTATRLLSKKAATMSLDKNDPGWDERFQKTVSKYENMPIEQLYKQFDNTFVESVRKAETYKKPKE